MILPGTAQQQSRQTHTVSATILVDGKNVTADPGGLMSLSIIQELNKVPTARLLFADGAVEKQTFKKSNSADFTPGKSVEIQLGYSQKEESVFKGIITRHSVRVLQGRPTYLEIECKDTCVKTTLICRSRYYYDKKDSEIIADILNAYDGLAEGDINATQTQHKEMVQYYCTDWDFMVMRADANGMYICAKDGKIDMKKPETGAEAQLQVQFGGGSAGIPLLEFESDIDARHHYPGVRSAAWDQAQQKILEDSAGSSAPGNAGGGIIGALSPGGTASRDFPEALYAGESIALYHGGGLDSKELSDWAASKNKRGELARQRGRVRVLGIETHPGDTIEINGIGERFNGKHLISGVHHQVYGGTWTTDIQYGWNKEFFAETIQGAQLDASGLVSGIRGLQTGIVSKVSGAGPEADQRIQVRIPYIAQNPNGTEAEGIWARLATLYAGENHGFVFRPEIGDEVVIGFINNDPNDAVIVGALHNGKNPAPGDIAADEDNTKKGLVSKEGLQALFDEKTKTILLRTGSSGADPQIEINGQAKTIKIALDSNNSIELSAQGVTVKGAKIDLN